MKINIGFIQVPMLVNLDFTPLINIVKPNAGQVRNLWFIYKLTENRPSKGI